MARRRNDGMPRGLPGGRLFDTAEGEGRQPRDRDVPAGTHPWAPSVLDEFAAVPCGAVNPRTGWVCSLTFGEQHIGYVGDRHLTIIDGERYDWKIS